MTPTNPHPLQSAPGAGSGPVRVQLSRRKGWRMPENTVKVSRPGRWGNPFQVALLGQKLAVDMFRDLMIGFFDPFKLKRLSDEDFAVVYAAKNAWAKRLNYGLEYRAAARHELRGKNLACWCALDQPCHADVLLELANRPTCDEPKPSLSGADHDG